MPDGYIIDTCIERCSQDEGHTNTNGLMLLDICKQTGMRILNGRFDNDKQGKYTFVGRSGSSLVDYVIATPNLFESVETFCVKEPNLTIV